MTDAYRKLKDELKTLATIGKASSVLAWDQQVIMPPYAAEERGEVLATLGKLTHERFTAPQIKKWIDAAEAEISDPWDKKNLELIKTDYIVSTALPSDFVFKLSQVRNQCWTTWQACKATSDWKTVLPHLRALMALSKEKAAYMGEALNRSPYDALLYTYAPGNSQKLVDPLFNELKAKLPPLVKEIVAKQKVPKQELTLSIEAQESLGREFAQKIGFSFDRGRIDRSTHPFSGGTNKDSRITTRYSTDVPFTSLFAVMHEVGHALYSQNLPEAYADTAVGGGRDLSLHESQSLSVEVQAGFSDGFLKYFYEAILRHEPSFANQASVDEFKEFIREVGPSFIRVDADEATYPLHVILRYEIEKEIFNNNLDAGDIPALWNAKFKEFFGLDVPEHNKGCMQDTHWFAGSFGYFPTYTQGALYAAQLMSGMRRDVLDIDDQLARGDFTAFIGWQKKNIHQWGQLYTAADLIEKATGAKPSAQYFLDHIKSRYLG